MRRHITAGLEAVIDSAYVCGGGGVVWVDDTDVSDTLRQIQKLTDDPFPDVEVFTHPPDETPVSEDRVALDIR